MIQDPNFIAQFTEQYGLTGLLFGGMLTLLLGMKKSQDKRIRDLETSQTTQQEQFLQAHKEMILQYVELVQNKTRILADLTGCLKAIKATLERMERSGS